MSEQKNKLLEVKDLKVSFFTPAGILSLMILALNLFGDGLRDALDPKLKK